MFVVIAPGLMGAPTFVGRDSKHGMLDRHKAVFGDPVPLTLHRWLQT